MVGSAASKSLNYAKTKKSEDALCQKQEPIYAKNEN
jgi:hypothetical protein